MEFFQVHLSGARASQTELTEVMWTDKEAMQILLHFTHKLWAACVSMATVSDPVS